MNTSYTPCESETNTAILKSNDYYSNYITEYSLSKSYFDPISSSPPNKFMEKLEKRINIYSKGSINKPF
jgi:5'-3' exonuclease